MYFATAQVEVPIFLPPLVAFGIAFITSMAGVSGAFLLLPFQMSFLGYTLPSVSATNHFFNIVATPGGFLRFIKEKRMNWPLSITLSIGALPGILLGGIIRITLFAEIASFKVFVACVLLLIGVRLAFSACSKGGSPTKPDNLKPERGVQLNHGMAHDGLAHEGPALGGGGPDGLSNITYSKYAIAYSFEGRDYSCNTIGVFVLSLLVGLVGGVYGIGGGALIAPFLAVVFGLPVRTISASTLFCTFTSSIFGVFCYSLLAMHYNGLSIAPDYLLGFLFGVGGFVGMFAGAKCQRFISEKILQTGLACLLLILALSYFYASYLAFFRGHLL